MDYRSITEAAFLDELEKIAGIGSFLGGGLSGWKQLLTGKASMGAVGRLGRMAYNQGARGGGGMWGGIKNLAKSQVGQMAAVPLAAGGALYAGHKLLGGGHQQQQGY